MASESEEIVVIPETTTPVNKTVYLIRHAESDENRRLGSLGRIFQGCTSLTRPNKSDFVASIELLNVQAQIDSDVSEVGRRQINQLGARLEEENFVEEKGVQLVAHSPLKRARQTSEGMLRCVTSRPDVTTDEDSTAAGAKANSVSRVVELEILKERTPIEWLPTNYDAFTKRIASFEKWLGEQPEDVIAIVGHSQYFKSMLGLDFKFGNCDVWELQFDGSVPTSHESVRIDEYTGETVEPKQKLTEALKNSLSFAKAKLVKDAKEDADDTKEDSSSPSDFQAENDTAQDISEEVTNIPRGW
eukprot:CAMPEP_0198261638 /NCGR_PEP_ID=MMETSP1447-20131203/10326_1 /TAXON_ID=420782 /ORGANISM="Chaetoceros dichaeta, Strain CCMP1751" /LENGTH=301 /DNA_ID=CAMNT_0043949621 /DNA_START=165 /DNA_END=1067 /DNA_ORIENTATION=-